MGMTDAAHQFKHLAKPNAMSYERAVNIVHSACRDELVKLAFDANLYEKGLCDTPHAEASFKKRERIKEALAVLYERCDYERNSEEETSSDEKETSSGEKDTSS
jgi:hypothetical protein